LTNQSAWAAPAQSRAAAVAASDRETVMASPRKLGRRYPGKAGESQSRVVVCGRCSAISGDQPMNVARFFAALLVATPALAAAPTADEIKKVEDYYESGKADGPVLLEFTPCLKVDKKPGEERKSC